MFIDWCPVPDRVRIGEELHIAERVPHRPRGPRQFDPARLLIDIEMTEHWIVLRPFCIDDEENARTFERWMAWSEHSRTVYVTPERIRLWSRTDIAMRKLAWLERIRRRARVWLNSLVGGPKLLDDAKPQGDDDAPDPDGRAVHG